MPRETRWAAGRGWLGQGPHQSAQGVNIAGLRADDDVVPSSQRLGRLHGVDLRGCSGDLPSLADVGLVQDWRR